MTSPGRPAEALINLRALSANLQRARDCAPNARLLAIIKANGYGHGIVRVARALQAADAFGVASIDEALLLRAAGIRHPVVLLEGVFDACGLDQASQYGLSVVVHHEMQLQLLESSSLASPVTVWLKIDTGMHRLGFTPQQLRPVYQRLRACRAVSRPICLMTHLANADDRHDDMTSRQLELFHQAVDGMDVEYSIANSAAILGWPWSHGDEHPSWVRPGIMLYGVSPFIDGSAAEHGLRPVMTLRSRLIAINHYRRGDAVGYGGAWRCPEGMPVGVVAIGYGDGYPRHAKPGTPVLVAGHRAPLIGRVSMDMISIDLRALPQADIGDEVVLWGGGLPIEEVARCAETIPYELLCRITQRVRIVEI